MNDMLIHTDVEGRCGNCGIPYVMNKSKCFDCCICDEDCLSELWEKYFEMIGKLYGELYIQNNYIN